MELKVGDKVVCERCAVWGIVEANDDGSTPKVNNIGTEKHPCIVCDECFEEYKTRMKE